VVPVVAPWVKDFSEMRKVRELGEGAYGTVTLVEDPSTDDLIALKLFREPLASDAQTMTAFFREVESMICLRHPCVIPIVGYSIDSRTLRAEIGSKYAVNGSLRDALKTLPPPRFVDDTGMAIIVCGIVLGMKFIHSRGLIHGDLKPENILVNELGHAGIVDFGSSRLGALSFGRGIGTPYYTAPEMYYNEDYTSAVDVYSFALILYEMLVGHCVFPLRVSEAALVEQIVTGARPVLPSTMDEAVAGIIRRCWSVNPGDRDTFDEVWRDLERIHFQLTRNVSCRQVAEYVLWVFERRQQQDPLLDCLRNITKPSTARPVAEWVTDLKWFDRVLDVSTTSLCPVGLYRHRLTGQQIAVKSFPKLDGDKERLFFREIEALSRLSRHPCIVPFFGYVLSVGPDGARVATHFMGGGSLHSVLRSSPPPGWWDGTAKSIVVLGIVLGMMALHDLGIWHRDLKPGNVLLDEDHRPRVCDFGSSRHQSLELTLTGGTQVGTAIYMAPELFDEIGYNEKVDIYSFALMLYEITVGRSVFSPTLSLAQLCRKVAVSGQRAEIPDTVPELARKLIVSGWSEDPAKRPSFAGIYDELAANDFCVEAEGFKREYIRAYEEWLRTYQGSETAIPAHF
jgi:serine/threonine protein kinase